MALTPQFELVDECADRFSFLYDIKKLEEMKEDFKMQGMKLYRALDVNGVEICYECRVLWEIVLQNSVTSLPALQLLKSLNGSLLKQIS
jgi:hypothetical protein